MATYDDVFTNSSYLLRLVVNEGTIDVPNNRSIANWSLTAIKTAGSGYWSNSPLTWSVNIGGNTDSGGKTYDFRNYSSLLLDSGSFWITHNSDGSKTISNSASAGGGTSIGSAACSGSLVLDTIPRASTPSFSPTSPDAGTTVTISTNRASSSFTHDISFSVNGGSSYTTIDTGVGTSTTWAIPLSIVSNWPSATSGTVIIRTITKSGSTTIGTTTKSMTVKVPSSVAPDFTTITHSEATSGVAANVGAYVRKVTKLALAITGAAGEYGSTISSYSIKIKNSSGTVLQTISSSSGTSAVVDASGTVTLEGTVTDSRGRTRTKTVTTTFLNWAAPVLTAVTAERALNTGVPNEEGTYIRVNINAAVSSLMNSTQRNSINYKISTRTRGTSTWTLKKTVNVPAPAISFNSFDTVSTYATTTAFDVLVEVYDDFATSAIQLTIATSSVFMYWGDGSAGQGVGIGKIWQAGALDIRGDLYLEANAVTGDVGKGTMQRLRLLSTSGVSLTSTGHAFQNGLDSGGNLVIDTDEIQARNNGAANTLLLNVRGGDVTIGASGNADVINARGHINNAFLPWAMAAGTVASAANSGSSAPVYWDGGVTVTFPSSRFSVTPIILATAYAAGQVLGANVITASSTSFLVRTIRFSAAVSGSDVFWTAIQMGSSAAAG